MAYTDDETDQDIKISSWIEEDRPANPQEIAQKSKEGKNETIDKFNDEFKKKIHNEIFIFAKKFSLIILVVAWALAILLIILLCSFVVSSIFGSPEKADTIETALAYFLQNLIFPVVTFVVGRLTNGVKLGSNNKKD